MRRRAKTADCDGSLLLHIAAISVTGKAAFATGGLCCSGVQECSGGQDRPGPSTARDNSRRRNAARQWSERDIRLLFEVSLWFKGVFAFLEIAAGLAAYFIAKRLVLGFVICEEGRGRRRPG